MKGRPGAVVRALTESPGRGFEAASPQILRGKGLSRFIPSPDPTHVGASGTGSALYHSTLSRVVGSTWLDKANFMI